MLNPVDRQNFETLVAAARNDDLTLLECRDKATGQDVPLVVAVAQDGDEAAVTPLARMLQGDPFDDYEPPEPMTVEEG